MALPKERYMATEYKISVDGLSIGSISYPFQVNFTDGTLNKLRFDVSKHYRVAPEGVTIEKLNKQARKDSWVWGQYYKLPLKGKIQ